MDEEKIETPAEPGLKQGEERVITRLVKNSAAWAKTHFYLLSIACVALGFFSFLGAALELRTVVDGQKISHALSLSDMLFKQSLGPAFQALMIAFWLVLPLVGVICAALRTLHKNFSAAAMLVFLVTGVLILVSKDLAANYMKAEVRHVYFPAIWMPATLFAAAFLMLLDGYEKDTYSAKDLAESGMLIAMALVLNFIKIFPMPTGGSVNLQVLPLFILALRHGPIKAFLGCGLVYGFLSCLIDGYGLFTLPFDYIVGFGSCAVLGFFRKLILGPSQKGYNLKGELFLLLAGILATGVRFLGGVASSLFIYGYAFEAAALYNVGYVFATGGISLAVLMALYGPLASLNARYRPSKKAD